MNNPRPLGMRKTVQLMVILTLLAWATQTLFHQWGYGGLILPEAGSTTLSESRAVTLELREQITCANGEVTLGDLCRWSEQDDELIKPFSGIILIRAGEASGARSVSVDAIKQALHDGGANLSTLHFSGAATCAVAIEAASTQEIAPGAKVEEASEPTTKPSEDAPQAVVAKERAPAPVEPPPAAPVKVTAGQFITVALKFGQIEVETVARALDEGGKGQVVRAKNEATGDIYRVTIVGPNEATQVISKEAL